MNPLQWLKELYGKMGMADQGEQLTADNGAFPVHTDPALILGYMTQQHREQADSNADLSRALGKRHFTTSNDGAALLGDDDGNTFTSPGGLGTQILGNQIADTYDRHQRQNYFNKLSSGNRHAVKSAAIGGAPLPTGVLAGPGWKARSGIMRGLMLASPLGGLKKVRY